MLKTKNAALLHCLSGVWSFIFLCFNHFVLIQKVFISESVGIGISYRFLMVSEIVLICFILMFSVIAVIYGAQQIKQGTVHRYLYAVGLTSAITTIILMIVSVLSLLPSIFTMGEVNIVANPRFDLLFLLSPLLAFSYAKRLKVA